MWLGLGWSVGEYRGGIYGFYSSSADGNCTAVLEQMLEGELGRQGQVLKISGRFVRNWASVLALLG